MQKTMKFNAIETMAVQNEKISGISLDFTTLQADGETLAQLADYNKVGFDIILERQGKKPVHIHNGYLENLLLGLYSQTPSYELWHKNYGDTHKVKIDFGGIIALKGGDKLIVKVNARNTSFTSLSLANSHITVESIPAAGSPSPIFLVESHGIPAGETNVTLSLGDNVMKVVAATDYTTDYFSSNKSKFDGIELTGSGNYKKSVSQGLLEVENISYFSNNPESDIEDLVLFASNVPVHDMQLRGKLDKAVVDQSNIIVVKRAYV